MLRVALLVGGITLLAFHHNGYVIGPQWQLGSFLTGIALLGIPHGAADMLVAAQNAKSRGRGFSKVYFFCAYLGQLALFGALLWISPLFGFLLFIGFAAYHFGETDLYLFDTSTVPGKILVVSYGLVILNVILFNNLDELQELVHQFDVSWGERFIQSWAKQYHIAVLSFSLLFFFCSTFLYFLRVRNSDLIADRFFIQFALLVFILYNLPLLTGFTFYFVIWHSVLSLRNIFNYLQKNQRHNLSAVWKQISLYSLIAIAGIIISGIFGMLSLKGNAFIGYVFAGLAVLTAPHMQVMHLMYNRIRTSRGVINQV